MRVIKYEGLESKAIDAKNIPIVFKKGEKLELTLDKEGADYTIRICIPEGSNYLLKQYASEEKARKAFEKYLKKLESGKYALHIIDPTVDQLIAELVLNQRYTTGIQRIIRGNSY